MSNVSTVVHFPLTLGYEEYTFIDQAVKKFEHCLDSIIMDSIKTPDLDASFDKPYATASSLYCW